MVKRILRGCFRRLRGLKLYRVSIGKVICRRISYRTATVDDVYACSKLYMPGKNAEREEHVDNFAMRLEGLTGWGYVMVASTGGKIVGAITIKRFNDSTAFYRDWWIFDMFVNPLYRRLGIAGKLVQAALKKVVQEGGVRTNLMVHKSNSAAINLYRKMGFQQASIPGLDASLEEEAQKGAHQRIIMSLSLSENQESDQP